jgi:hypothetical protein
VGATIVGCHDFHVFDLTPAVTILVLNPKVGKLNVAANNGQIVLLGPASDFDRVSLGSSAAAPPAAVRSLEEGLVVPLQLAFQDDPANATAISGQAFGRRHIRCVDPRIVSQLSRLRDTGIEDLTMFGLSCPTSVLQQLPTALR